MSGGAVSERILGYQPWIHEDPALTGLDARWRVMDAFGDYRQVLTLAVPPLEELGGPGAALDLAGEPRRIRSNFTNGLKSLPLRLTPA